MAFCPKCGTTIPEGSTDKFCPTCGQQLAGNEAPTTEEKKESSINTDEMIEKGKEVAGEALEKGKEVAGEALEKGKEIFGNVVEQAKNVDVNGIVDQVKAGDKKTIGSLAIGAVAIIAVIALLASLLGGGGYMAPINGYVNAINKQQTDAKAVMKAVYGSKLTDAVYKVAKSREELDMTSFDVEDLNDKYEEMYEAVEEEFDKYKVSFEKSKEKKLDKDDLEDIQEKLNENYEDAYEELTDALEDEDDLEDIADKYDIDEKDAKAFVKEMAAFYKLYAEAKITEGYEVKGKFIIKADKDEFKTENVKITVLKMNGEWIYYTNEGGISMKCDSGDDEYVFNNLFNGFGIQPMYLLWY